ncbi:hypothetical protein MDA_GLEAN10013826 [Myotis davidii]|uniref:Uncharacterized protein n=1 Tax=Myotis davidii TaxID=225400 RepID=L5M835_MYODS|nr:hypothetical protein MDA_GLEAN10013826 [Myotis davidii]
MGGAGWVALKGVLDQGGGPHWGAWTAWGRMRMQFPTTTDYVVEFATFGEITGVSTPGVQWVSLTLRKSPSRSWYLPRQEEGRGIESETSMREKHRPAASCTPPTGDVPTTKVYALDRNRTWDPSVRRPTLYPPSQTGFGDNILI